MSRLVGRIAAIGAWLAEPVAWGDRRLRGMVPAALSRWLVGRYAATLPGSAAALADATTPVEIFLRVGPRDLTIAPHALASLRTHLVNAVSRVVVATPSAHVRELTRQMADTVVVADEDLVSPPLRATIESSVIHSRRHWVAQQFLTLVHVSAACRLPCLIWDADTLLLRRQAVLHGGVAMLALSRDHHEPYYAHVHSLLPSLPLPAWGGFVGHHMVMDPRLLNELLLEIERDCGEPWWSAILHRVDPLEVSCMSEYELYGHWVRTRHPDRVRIVPLRNLGLSRREGTDLATQEWAARHGVDSVSLHWWISETRS